MKALLTLLGCLGGTAAWAADLPEWIRAQPPGADAWEAHAPAVAVLESTALRWTNPKEIIRTERALVSARTLQGVAITRAGVAWNPDVDRVISARAWVLGPDGRLIRTVGKGAFSDEALVVSRIIWDRYRVLEYAPGGSLPVGGYLAWEIVVAFNPGFPAASEAFSPQRPVWHHTFEAAPYPGGKLDWYATEERLRNPTAGAEPGSLHWELDRQASPLADSPGAFLPPVKDVFVRVSTGEPASWQHFAAEAAAIMLPGARSDPSVTALARQLVAGHPNRWDRIRALCQWTQSQIVYLSIRLDRDSLAGYRPHPAATVIQNRYGDCKDKASLLVALLGAVGEDARIVLLWAEDPQRVDPNWAGNSFNHAITAIPAGDAPADWPVVDTPAGKFVIFDPTSPFTPLGVLPVSDQGGWGLIVDPMQGSLVQLPMVSPRANALRRQIDATVSEDGSVRADVAESASGPLGAREHAARVELTADRYGLRIESIVHAVHPLFTGFDCSQHWDEPSSVFSNRFTFVVPAWSRRLGDSMRMVSPAVLPLRSDLRPWHHALRGRCFLIPEAAELTVVLHAPASYRLEEMPEPWHGSAADSSASVDYSPVAGGVTMHVAVMRKGGFYNQSDYSALRQLEQQVMQHERAPILFRVAHS